MRPASQLLSHCGDLDLFLQSGEVRESSTASASALAASFDPDAATSLSAALSATMLPRRRRGLYTFAWHFCLLLLRGNDASLLTDFFWRSSSASHCSRRAFASATCFFLAIINLLARPASSSNFRPRRQALLFTLCLLGRGSSHSLSEQLSQLPAAAIFISELGLIAFWILRFMTMQTCCWSVEFECLGVEWSMGCCACVLVLIPST